MDDSRANRKPQPSPIGSAVIGLKIGPDDAQSNLDEDKGGSFPIMAEMFPPTWPGGNRSEKLVYDALNQAFPEHQWKVVYHVLLGEGRRDSPREIDFVLVHPDHGMLVVEVKGGTIGYDPHDGWYTQPTFPAGAARERLKYGGPYNQALTAGHRMINMICERFGFRKKSLPFGWGHYAVFPDCRIDWAAGNYPPKRVRLKVE